MLDKIAMLVLCAGIYTHAHVCVASQFIPFYGVIVHIGENYNIIVFGIKYIM